jgi:EAL domain-containing protein (putative c-di-GMP-specific phosphodiesterase class I)
MEPTILFVDDEVNITEGLERALFAEPFRILTASSGHEALDILAREPVDVVISDEQMPEMSGSQLLTRIRVQYPEVVRIILTGQASLDATLRAINEAAVFRYLRKPCRPPEVAATIFEALASRVDSGASTRDAEALAFSEAVSSVYVVFQPIVSVRTGRPVAVEALARPAHPRFPDVGALLHTAERLHRMAELELAIHARIAEVAPLLPADLDLFVNIHPQSLGNPDLWSDAAPLMLHARRLVVEVTERALVHGGSALKEMLQGLRGRGARVALDDLGAGHAGLATIATIEPDVIKLDMSLVRGIDGSSALASVVASLVDLARRLGVMLVAEGVETEAERDTLVDLGCEYLQGYLYARPAPVGELAGTLT